MPSYRELKQQIEALKLQAEEQRKKEIEVVIARIKEMMAEYELTARDLGFSERRRGGHKEASKTMSVAKYRNPSTGDTWSGMGRKPRWLAEAIAQGRSIDEFRIK